MAASSCICQMFRSCMQDSNGPAGMWPFSMSIQVPWFPSAHSLSHPHGRPDNGKAHRYIDCSAGTSDALYIVLQATATEGDGQATPDAPLAGSSQSKRSPTSPELNAASGQSVLDAAAGFEQTAIRKAKAAEARWVSYCLLMLFSEI